MRTTSNLEELWPEDESENLQLRRLIVIIVCTCLKVHDHMTSTRNATRLKLQDFWLAKIGELDWTSTRLIGNTILNHIVITMLLRGR